jgi:anti-sigma factor (TIGR02949 family)
VTDPLTCRQAFDRLEDFLDRELAAEEVVLVRAHLEVCEQCTREFHFEARVLDGVRAKLGRIQVPADLAERIRRALAEASGG